MWSLEFVQVADDELITKKLSDRYDDADSVSRDSADTMSRAVDIPTSSVSNRHTNVGLTEYSSSVDSDTGHMQYAVDNWLTAEKQRSDVTSHVDTIDSDIQQHTKDVSATSTAAAGEMFIMDEHEDSAQSHGSVSRIRSTPKLESLSSITTVSIDTSECGDFCFVTEQDISDVESGLQRRKLRDGFHWQKQLVFRSKLTMHTAFERKDNKDPAAVTALAVSRYSMSIFLTSHFYLIN